MKAAFFDFDGTLRPGDSLPEYLLYALKKGRLPPAACPGIAGAFLAHRLWGSPSLEAIKTRCLRFEARMSPEERASFTDAFTREILMKNCFADALKQWEQCRQEGCLVVLATASTQNYMADVARLLKADGLICTVFRDGTAGKNCKGEEKARRVLLWMQERDIRPEDCMAFGNSMADLPMLRCVGTPLAVNPSRRLRRAGLPTAQWR